MDFYDDFPAGFAALYAILGLASSFSHLVNLAIDNVASAIRTMPVYHAATFPKVRSNSNSDT